MPSLTWRAFALVFLAVPALAGEQSVFASVSLDRQQMNATLGHTVSVTVMLRRAGTLDVLVVDRDGFAVRQLARQSIAPAAGSRFTWDGRGSDGRVVPDEAYSFRIEWRDGKAREVYFPANAPAHMSALPTNGYFAQTATLSYTLPAPSRVHVQAGVAVKNPKTGVMEGPVMKTVVNRAPRAAGKIADQWNGLDESGTIFIPDLPDFVVAVAATPLPANSVITIGNRERTFAEAAVGRSGKSLFTYEVHSHAHHMGLAVLDDVSPGLRIEPINATWSEQERLWITDDRTVRLKLTLTGPAATSFGRHPAKMFRFVNQKLTGATRAAQGQVTVSVPRSEVHNFSFNWRSDYGAVAANTVRIRRASPGGGAPVAAKGTAR